MNRVKRAITRSSARRGCERRCCCRPHIARTGDFSAATPGRTRRAPRGSLPQYTAALVPPPDAPSFRAGTRSCDRETSGPTHGDALALRNDFTSIRSSRGLSAPSCRTCSAYQPRAGCEATASQTGPSAAAGLPASPPDHQSAEGLHDRRQAGQGYRDFGWEPENVAGVEGAVGDYQARSGGGRARALRPQHLARVRIDYCLAASAWGAVFGMAQAHEVRFAGIRNIDEERSRTRQRSARCRVHDRA
jgi:hypothetical protein